MIGTLKDIYLKLTPIVFSSGNKQYELKEYHAKRSRSQNSYMWEIISKIADKVRLQKEDVYLQMLKDYGQSEIVSIKSDINPKGYFKYYEAIGTGRINNTDFTHYRIFKGSSQYNSQEMSVLIDGVIQEAKQLDIETMPVEEIRSLRII